MGMASPGDPLKISAADWNDLLRMLADYRQRVRLPERQDPSINAAGVVVAVRNDSGSDRKAYENLRLEGNIVDDNYRVDWAHNGPIFVGKLPGDAALVGDTMTPFVVLLDPIPAGEVGRGVLVGATWAKLNLTSLSHTRARMTEDDPTKLASDSQGSAKILYCPPVEGEQLAIVQQSADSPAGSLRVKNFHDETFPKYSVIQITGLVDSISIGSPVPDSYPPDAVYYGMLYENPSSYYDHSTWGVTLEEIAPGAIGRVAVDGIFPVMVDDAVEAAYPMMAVTPVHGSMKARYTERGPASVVLRGGTDADTYWALVNLNHRDQWHGVAVIGQREIDSAYPSYLGLIDDDLTKAYGVGATNADYYSETTIVTASHLLEGVEVPEGTDWGGLTITQVLPTSVAFVPGVRAKTGILAPGGSFVERAALVHATASWSLKYKDQYKGELSDIADEDLYNRFEFYFAMFDENGDWDANAGQSRRLEWIEKANEIKIIIPPGTYGTNAGHFTSYNDLHETKQVTIEFLGGIPQGYTLVPLFKRVDGTLDFYVVNSFFKVTEIKPSHLPSQPAAGWVTEWP